MKKTRFVVRARKNVFLLDISDWVLDENRNERWPWCLRDFLEIKNENQRFQLNFVFARTKSNLDWEKPNSDKEPTRPSEEGRLRSNFGLDRRNLRWKYKRSRSTVNRSTTKFDSIRKKSFRALFLRFYRTENVQQIGQLSVKIADDENVTQIRKINVIEIRQTFENCSSLMKDDANVFLVENLKRQDFSSSETKPQRNSTWPRWNASIKSTKTLRVIGPSIPERKKEQKHFSFFALFHSVKIYSGRDNSTRLEFRPDLSVSTILFLLLFCFGKNKFKEKSYRHSEEFFPFDSTFLYRRANRLCVTTWKPTAINFPTLWVTFRTFLSAKNEKISTVFLSFPFPLSWTNFCFGLFARIF